MAFFLALAADVAEEGESFFAGGAVTRASCAGSTAGGAGQTLGPVEVDSFPAAGRASAVFIQEQESVLVAGGAEGRRPEALSAHGIAAEAGLHQEEQRR